MEVSVSGVLMYRKVLGDRDQPLRLRVSEGTTIMQLLLLLSEKLGENFTKLVFEQGNVEKVKKTVTFQLNGNPHWNLPQQLETKLHGGDEIFLIPMMTGG